MRDWIERVLILSVLLVALAAMTVHYGAVAANDGHDAVQVSTQKLAAEEIRIGERLYVWGEVVEPTETGFRLLSAGRTLTVEDSGVRVTRGDVVQVYGRAQPNDVIAAKRVVVSGQHRLQYMYGISAIGGLLAAALFVRSWRIDLRQLRITPRDHDD